MNAAPIGERLLKGAYILGYNWKRRVRCQNGWRQDCTCEPKTSFCKAKLHWLKLAAMDLQDGAERYIPEADNDYYIIETMKIAEFKKMGLTLNIELKGGGVLNFGPNSDLPLGEIAQDDELSKAVSSIVKAFPGAEIVSSNTGENK
jgi:hypothetical protein